MHFDEGFLYMGHAVCLTNSDQFFDIGFTLKGHAQV